SIFRESFGESSPGHIFHCQERLIRHFTRFVQNYDVRMLQSRYGFSLAQKTMPLILRSVTAVPNYFLRHQSVQPNMPGFKDLTHRAVPEGLDQLILTELFDYRTFQCMERPDAPAKLSRRLRQEIIRQTFVFPPAPVLRLLQSHALQTIR